MFGKNTYGSLLQQDSRASTNPGLHGSEILLTHHQDLLSSHYHPVPDPAVLYSNQELGHGLNAVIEPSSAPRTTTAKKDRHSKINTAQGPRDRRVRLSIGVARKFFDLQEMLGFDKPSKTLDWLLTKSKSAIKHMVQTKGSTTTKSVVSSLSECEENNNNDSSNLRTKEKSVAPTRNNSSKKKIRAKVDAQHQEALNLAKESRVKARARARERTMEKMCIKQQQQQHRMNGTSGYNLIPIPYMNNQEYHQEDLIQESIVSKRRVIKHTSDNNNPSIFGFQTSYGMPSSSFSNAAADNWDISNYATQSSICAILDQHKFNHS